MLAHRVAEGAKALLGRLGWVDAGLPASYRDGADTPVRVPVTAIPDPAAALRASLDAAALEALAGPREMTVENVEAVLDEMVRPALQADGGDIRLIRIEDDNIYVRLVGACSSCPSSIMTLRMGVERLLQDEFPQMQELIQVDSMFE